MNAVLVVLQTACVAAATAAAWVWTRSLAISVVVASIALSSPFPNGWLDRPIGGVDAVTALAMIAVLASTPGSSRWSAALRWGGAFVAVLFSGWPALAVLAFALVRRDRTGMHLVLAVATALALRLVIGVPPLHVLGSFAVADPRGSRCSESSSPSHFRSQPPGISPHVAPRSRAAFASASGGSGRDALANRRRLVLVRRLGVAYARRRRVAVYVAELAVVLTIATRRAALAGRAGAPGRARARYPARRHRAASRAPRTSGHRRQRARRERPERRTRPRRCNIRRDRRRRKHTAIRTAGSVVLRGARRSCRSTRPQIAGRRSQGPSSSSSAAGLNRIDGSARGAQGSSPKRGSGRRTISMRIAPKARSMTARTKIHPAASASSRP